MIKLTFCLKRLPHLTRGEFLDYWLNTHGVIVKKHAALLNVRRYVQVHTAQQHTLDDPINEALRAARGAPEAFDGVAELWWESKEEMESAFASPEGRAAGKELWEDEKNFIDHAHSPLWIGEEKPIVGE